MKLFYHNGEGDGKGAVSSRKMHSQVLRGLGVLPERDNIELNFEKRLQGEQAEKVSEEQPSLREWHNQVVLKL